HRHPGAAAGKDQEQPHRPGAAPAAELPLRAAHGLCGADQRAGAAGSARPVGARRQAKMKAVLTVLGSGTSMGVPTIGCTCAVCSSPDPYDRRTRPSVLVQYEGHAVLIDTTPDFRQQAIRERLRHLDAVLYTHSHADHILGLDDLRPLTYNHVRGKLPLYADERTGRQICSVFRYVFEGTYKYGGLAQVELHTITGALELFGVTFE